MDVDADAANAALEKADARELHTLFQRSQERLVALEKVFNGVVEHYVGGKEMPRFQPSNDNAIAAMERVAIEALNLARLVVVAVREHAQSTELDDAGPPSSRDVD
jgi:hypothetical protein